MKKAHLPERDLRVWASGLFAVLRGNYFDAAGAAAAADAEAEADAAFLCIFFDAIDAAAEAEAGAEAAAEAAGAEAIAEAEAEAEAPAKAEVANMETTRAARILDMFISFYVRSIQVNLFP